MSNSKRKKPKGSMETFFKVLRMIGNYRFLLILSIVLAAVTVVLQLYVPILFGNAIDEVVGALPLILTGCGITSPGFSSWLSSPPFPPGL